MSMRRRAAAVALSLALSLAAAAAEPAAGPLRTGLGLAIAHAERPYRGASARTRWRPFAVYEGRRLHLHGDAASFDLAAGEAFALAAVASLAQDGYAPDDAPVLAGMAERGAPLWAGASLRWRRGAFEAALEWTADVSGHSDGRRAALRAQRAFDLGRWRLAPRAVATRLDARAAGYYHGVRAEEARTGRPAYAPGASVSLGVGLHLARRLGPADAVFLDLGAERAGASLRAGPLGGDGVRTHAVVGYLRMF
ncbi:MipA/OmpV family protein [Luteimonas huabeiensis]|uniref:MipA/OmpV family protein n=1 Tax=Luteimonas huabeiensis TaxID=1244513 RepID=UPI000467221A|nr:MipA/OmpV family protein [Luteimonas huabeiensis]